MTTPELVSARRMSSQSVDFLTAWVDSTRGGAVEGVSLSSQPVAIAFTAVGHDPDVTTTWRSATWFGTAGVARGAGILIGPGTSHVIAEGKYEVYVKVTDNPTIPVGHAGRLTIF